MGVVGGEFYLLLYSIALRTIYHVHLSYPVVEIKVKSLTSLYEPKTRINKD